MTGVAMTTKRPVAFDISEMTVRDGMAFQRALRSWDVPEIAALLARFATSCPWGDPNDPETWANLPFFSEFKGAISAFQQALEMERTRGRSEKYPEVGFDLERITAIEFGRFVKGTQENDIGATIDLWSKCVTRCEWGDPPDKQMWMRLRLCYEYQYVSERFLEEGKRIMGE
jgi:hypothetical protein